MTSSEPRSFQCITAARAAELIRSEAAMTIFDVRDPVSYQQAHVAAAAHLTEQRLGAWLRRLDKEMPILIYCYHGNASKTYAQMFVDFRFTRVYSVDGGYQPLAAALGAQREVLPAAQGGSQP